jgi:hypothetical protein
MSINTGMTRDEGTISTDHDVAEEAKKGCPIGETHDWACGRWVPKVIFVPSPSEMVEKADGVRIRALLGLVLGSIRQSTDEPDVLLMVDGYSWVERQRVKAYLTKKGWFVREVKQTFWHWFKFGKKTLWRVSPSLESMLEGVPDSVFEEKEP